MLRVRDVSVVPRRSLVVLRFVGPVGGVVVAIGGERLRRRRMWMTVGMCVDRDVEHARDPVSVRNATILVRVNGLRRRQHEPGRREYRKEEGDQPRHDRDHISGNGVAQATHGECASSRGRRPMARGDE